jgi:hypothetical protein
MLSTGHNFSSSRLDTRARSEIIVASSISQKASREFIPAQLDSRNFAGFLVEVVSICIFWTGSRFLRLNLRIVYIASKPVVGFEAFFLNTRKIIGSAR